ncbi:MAG: LysM peptidoglycan-binding domain-containing protein [Frankiaceae bacterium]|nr:LysM peptidoglycan-binding domain-containing protein [Frankiaceae bacterium]
MLLAAAPSPSTAAAALAARGADPVAPVVALAALAAWSLVGWLLLVTAGTLAARLPGASGRTAGTVTRRIAPAAVRRLVEMSLGLTVAVGGLAGSPAFASPAIPPAPPAATASLDWPADTSPTLDWNPPAPTTDPVRARPVVVQPGDSLWAVAADHLPPGASAARIATAWPAWWAANREAVGADPDLIHPGLELHPPAQC